MPTLFTPHDRQICINRAVAQMHQKQDSILAEIERDLFVPGRGHAVARLAEVFRLVDTIIDDVLAHDQEEAEFQLRQAEVTGQAPKLNPFAEEREKELLDQVMGQFAAMIKHLPDRVERPKLAALLERSPNELELRRSYQETEADVRIRKEYRVRRAYFELNGREPQESAVARNGQIQSTAANVPGFSDLRKPLDALDNCLRLLAQTNPADWSDTACGELWSRLRDVASELESAGLKDLACRQLETPMLERSPGDGDRYSAAFLALQLVQAALGDYPVDVAYRTMRAAQQKCVDQARRFIVQLGRGLVRRTKTPQSAMMDSGQSRIPTSGAAEEDDCCGVRMPEAESVRVLEQLRDMAALSAAGGTVTEPAIKSALRQLEGVTADYRPASATTAQAPISAACDMWKAAAAVYEQVYQRMTEIAGWKPPESMEPSDRSIHADEQGNIYHRVTFDARLFPPSLDQLWRPNTWVGIRDMLLNIPLEELRREQVRVRQSSGISGEHVSGAKLLDALQASGTGDNKLRYGRELLQRKPDASAEEVIQAMEAAGVTPVTINKAREFLPNVAKPITLQWLKTLLEWSGQRKDYLARHIEPIPEWGFIRGACRELFTVSQVDADTLHRLADKLRIRAAVENPEGMPLEELRHPINKLLDTADPKAHHDKSGLADPSPSVGSIDGDITASIDGFMAFAERNDFGSNGNKPLDTEREAELQWRDANLYGLCLRASLSIPDVLMPGASFRPFGNLKLPYFMTGGPGGGRRIHASDAWKQSMRGLRADAAQITKSADSGGEPFAASALVEALDDLPPYKPAEQPWWTPLPTMKNGAESQLAAFGNEIDVVIMTATEVERDAALRRLNPLPSRRKVVKGFVGPETYFVGLFGEVKAVVTKCRMGAVGPGSASLAAEQAQRVWQPRAIIMVGIAFGKDPTKQRIGDVLVASEVIFYEPQRVGTEIVQRGIIPPSNPTLLNRFENAVGWDFHRPDNVQSVCRVGPILSGEKLVDDPEFKACLFGKYPQAIGGEMEGSGLCAAAIRSNCPWILLKAICDWGDGKKHKRHQPLAAAAAVSLAHHVLSQRDVLHGLHKPNKV